jgi:cytochrome c oxidase cbb3-type subunit III
VTFRQHAAGLELCLLTMSLMACGRMPGRPSGGPEVPRPEEVTSFKVLYAENCAGCHGKDGQNGPATNLANSTYQALVDDTTLREITAKGQKGTLMPGFAEQSGGPLTEAQVDVIVRGMRERWRRPDGPSNVPPYMPHTKPNLQHGAQVYAQACSRCHGAGLQNPGSAGSVLDGSFLGLISDQVLRTTTIAGRPDLGMPDWRNEMAGKPLADQDVTDVVAWIGSQRPKAPGQPYPNPQTNPHQTSSSHPESGQ